MLFSATFPKATRDLAQDHLAAEHVRVRVGRAGSTVKYIKQNIMEIVPPRTKNEVLLEILQSMPPTRTIIFVNSRRAADEVDDYLFNMGLPCTSITGDRTQLEREASMRAFRSGRAPILIATAVSARGIDVRKVQHVVNYDLPSLEHGGIEEYTHRIGKVPPVRVHWPLLILRETRSHWSHGPPRSFHFVLHRGGRADGQCPGSHSAGD